MTSEWSIIEKGPMHMMQFNDRIKAYITTRITGWQQFGEDAPDWWWRIDLDDGAIGEGVVDERADFDIQTNAFSAAMDVALMYCERTQAYLDRKSL